VQAQKGKQGETPMALTVLNNISSLTAENALANTQASLQKTLQQLSTGMKINSGSDDAAGLSIVSGMNANIAALTQSQQNASNGIGLLQTADGALSQVTSLLNRATTLATEGSTAGITASQSSALDTEYQSILSEINQIGQATNYNGSNVFSSATPTTFTSTQGSVSTPLATTTNLTAGSVTTITDSKTGGTFVYTAQAVGGSGAGTGGLSDIADLQAAIATAITAGTLSSGVTSAINGAGQLDISSNNSADSLNVTTNDAALGTMNSQSPSYTTNATTALTAASTLAVGNVTVTLNDGHTAIYTNAAASTIGNLVTTVNAGVTTGGEVISGTATAAELLGLKASINGSGQLQVNDANGNISTAVASVAALGTMTQTNGASNSDTVYLGDGTTSLSNSTITTNIAALSASELNLTGNLTTAATAQTSLLAITSAINAVSLQRGVIGASVNRLTAASGDMASQVTNLQSASNGLQNADIGKTVANMTQYNVLQSTGMAALQQSNQAQQAVLKLVQ
jgi:flagellin